MTDHPTDLTDEPTRRGDFERIDSMPSHKSPPDDGIVYCTVNRAVYRLMGGIYTDGELRKGLNVADDMALWVAVPGQNDVLIEDATVTILTSGRRFFTAPKIINGGCS